MNLLEEIINKEIKEVKCKEKYYILFAEGKYKEAKKYYIENIEYLPQEGCKTNNFTLDYNNFCSNIYIKLGRPPCYNIEIEKIKNDSKTKIEYKKSIKEKSGKRIEQLNNFLEKNLNNYDEDFKKLNKLYEEEMRLENKIKRLKFKYEKYFIHTDIEYEYNLNPIVRKFNYHIDKIYKLFELAEIEKNDEVVTQINILITLLNSLRNDYNNKRITENILNDVMNYLPKSYKECSVNKIKQINIYINKIQNKYWNKL